MAEWNLADDVPTNGAEFYNYMQGMATLLKTVIEETGDLTDSSGTVQIPTGKLYNWPTSVSLAGGAEVSMTVYLSLPSGSTPLSLLDRGPDAALGALNCYAYKSGTDTAVVVLKNLGSNLLNVTPTNTKVFVTSATLGVSQ